MFVVFPFVSVHVTLFNVNVSAMFMFVVVWFPIMLSVSNIVKLVKL